MWSFYATPYTSPIVGPPTIPVTGYYPYSDRRPPPKSTELFDPNKSNSINSNTSPQNKNNNNNMYKYNNNINGNIMNGTVTINGMVVEDRGLHANFKRSPSHDSFFNSTTKQDDESSNSADGTDKPRKKSPVTRRDRPSSLPRPNHFLAGTARPLLLETRCCFFCLRLTFFASDASTFGSYSRSYR